ncbi:hypothetical protein M0R88_03165 [Halorussus gelatinilyticus]|uniref:Uncharacterized protein n=1 Tax=Halorussus gelatinilyticus TaxID=2937524 RepID=A0A8U0IM66_9EURY|nr:hypothetical protein [Halorussus gelatinilyticus]UPW01109.1 hypothetical protein M0R88_03165 [Halorussus gelatinilyticus]
MAQCAREYDRIRTVLAEADADERLTAREILQLLDARGESFESAHRVATVLGRRARSGDVTVIRSSPYRYRLDT